MRDVGLIKFCVIEGCDRPYLAKGLCRLHYDRAWRGIDLLDPRGNNRRKLVCSVERCGRTARSRGFCDMHYLRSRSGRDLSAPARTQHAALCSVEGCSRPFLANGFAGRTIGDTERAVSCSPP
jgi:hypothetical protein